MPLYECSKCGAIENTATGGYWSQQLDAMDSKTEFKPKCSECITGTWHGLFAKRNAKAERYEPDVKMAGFIQPKGGWPR